MRLEVQVFITADVGQAGAPKLVSNTTPAGFTVNRRTWPIWNVDNLRAVRDSVMEFEMWDDLFIDNTLGLFREVKPEPETYAVSSPPTGPNKGLFYLSQPVEITQYDIWIHPGISPKPGNVQPGHPDFPKWRGYEDHNRVNEPGPLLAPPPPVGAATCRAKDVKTLRTIVARHEGVTRDPNNSHWGISKAQLPFLKLERFVESEYSPLTEGEFRLQVSLKVHQLIWGGSLLALHNQFGANEFSPAGGNVWGIIGCRFDWYNL